MAKEIHIDPKTPLKINNGRPVSEAYLNTFFRVFSVEHVLGFERLYRELEDKIQAINMTPEDFMKQVNDAYRRYQDSKNLDHFYPMDKKGFQYVENFMRVSIEKVYNMIQQQKARQQKK
ncbi:MAG: hypothetical protein NZM25_02755 [Leptospiraceae bacterium]|nr:hypothetical protein [Leptospiraceae bacterium]MDW8307188.1 hypothetical protein [Leptospiraceae bacterium]